MRFVDGILYLTAREKKNIAEVRKFLQQPVWKILGMSRAEWKAYKSGKFETRKPKRQVRP